MKFTTFWRVVNDPMEIHQFVAVGGRLVCPAVLAGCGPSKNRPGEFWWNVKTTPVSERLETQYSSTIEDAKRGVTDYLRLYLEWMAETREEKS